MRCRSVTLNLANIFRTIMAHLWSTVFSSNASNSLRNSFNKNTYLLSVLIILKTITKIIWKTMKGANQLAAVESERARIADSAPSPQDAALLVSLAVVRRGFHVYLVKITWTGDSQDVKKLEKFRFIAEFNANGFTFWHKSEYICNFVVKNTVW